MEVVVGLLTVVFPGFVVILLFVLSGLKIVNQYERGVVLTLGKYTGMREPGLRYIVPVFQKMMRVDVRSMPIDVPKQEVITKDNVTIGVDAVVYLRVVDSAKAMLETTNYVYATSQFAQAALRDVTGGADLDELLASREAISEKIKAIVDSETDRWGIDVENVKVQNIELPQEMKRAMAKQAEAERERRAKIIAAEGEQMSATKLGEAADIIAAHPIALQLRNLQVMTEIAVEKNSTIIFPNQFMDTMQSVNNFMAKEATRK
ncbi:MAG TPA: slipin family protein [Candidatus Saccharimonas sp.]|jgi:regulator of protease activity HflC (stomatin/prohibitin superfamily)|nr:slipin family protein [Candidatus Saccharimonas sp.]